MLVHLTDGSSDPLDIGKVSREGKAKLNHPKWVIEQGLKV
jgi:hypothetical protein